jgi:hypothetical protein
MLASIIKGRDEAWCYLAGIILSIIVYSLFLRASGAVDRLVPASLLILAAALMLYARRWPYQIGTMVVVFALFAMPLVWQWETAIYTGNVISGLFPWSDANGYYWEALKLLYGEPFGEFASRRPLFAGFLSVILSITGMNLQHTLIILCGINAIACTMLAYEIRRTFGVISAAIVLVLMFYYYKSYPFVGTTLTENIGLSMGALGLSALIRGAAQARMGGLLYGSFLLSVALNARAGAMLVLPAIIVWALIKDGSREVRKNAFVALSIGLAITAGFASTMVLHKTICSEQSRPFSNFGPVLYGLASGYKGWTYIYKEHPGTAENGVMALAIEKIRTNPKMLFVGIKKAYEDLLTNIFRLLYRLDADHQRMSLLLYAFTILCLLRLIKNIRDPISSALILINVGILASVPFAPPIDDGIRAMTSTMPVTGLTAAYLFGRKRREIDTNGLKAYNIADYSGIAGVVLTLVCVSGPIYLKTIAKPPDISSHGYCQEGYECMTIDVRNGSYVNIVGDDSADSSMVPTIRYSDYISAMKGKEAQYPELWAALNEVTAGQSIIMGLNLEDFKNKSVGYPVWMITQTAAITNGNGVNQFRARPTTNALLRNYRFYYDRSVDAKISGEVSK